VLLEVGVHAAEGHVAGGLLHVVRADDGAHVVGEGVEVDRAGSLEVVEVAVGSISRLTSFSRAEAPRVAEG
jgi:hypothetical protein